MSVQRGLDPNAKLGVARAWNAIGSVGILISTTLITAGTKILGVGAVNMSNYAGVVHFMDESTVTGNVSGAQPFISLSLAANDVAYIELPVPYVVVSGCSVVPSLNESKTAAYVYYEA